MVPDTFPGMFWAYFAVWAIFVLYLFGLAARIRRLENKLRDDQR